MENIEYSSYGWIIEETIVFNVTFLILTEEEWVDNSAEKISLRVSCQAKFPTTHKWGRILYGAISALNLILVRTTSHV